MFCRLGGNSSRKFELGDMEIRTDVLKRKGGIIPFSRTWGDNYDISRVNEADDKIPFKTYDAQGWKSLYDGSMHNNVQVGDIIKVPCEGNKTGFLIFIWVEYMNDPKDMFFAKMAAVCVCDNERADSIGYDQIYDFAVEGETHLVKYFNKEGELKVNIKEGLFKSDLAYVDIHR